MARPCRERRRPARALLVALAALAPGVAACPEGAERRPPDIVLVVVDTLRADPLSRADGPPRTAPRLRRLARRGVHFRRAYAHSSSTRPSVATLLTGRLPSAHGVVTHGRDALAPEVPYLPQLLQEAGYWTIGVVTNPQIHPRLGFARGFDVFRAIFPEALEPASLTAFDLVTRPADEVLARARAEIAEAPPDRPLFAYVHLLDPHAPYRAPPPWRERFAGEPYQGPVTGTLFDFAAKDAMREDRRHLERFRSLYDAEVAFTDHALGAFATWLRESGRMARTHLWIASDHGEEFLEHGELGHGTSLFEEVVRAPLLWLGPGVAEGRPSEALVGLVDLAPSLLELAGVAPPEAGFQGRSLVAEGRWGAASGSRAAREALLLEGPSAGAVRRGKGRVPRVARAVVAGRHKILSPQNVRGEPGHGDLLLFDLEAGPGEQAGRRLASGADAPAEDRRWVALYRRTVARALAMPAPSRVPAVTLPEEALEQLRSLGYVAPSAPSAPASGAEDGAGALP